MGISLIKLLHSMQRCVGRERWLRFDSFRLILSDSSQRIRLQPDVISYNATIDGCEKCCRCRGAFFPSNGGNCSQILFDGSILCFMFCFVSLYFSSNLWCRATALSLVPVYWWAEKAGMLVALGSWVAPSVPVDWRNRSELRRSAKGWFLGSRLLDRWSVAVQLLGDLQSSADELSNSAGDESIGEEKTRPEVVQWFNPLTIDDIDGHA